MKAAHNSNGEKGSRIYRLRSIQRPPTPSSAKRLPSPIKSQYGAVAIGQGDRHSAWVTPANSCCTDNPTSKVFSLLISPCKLPIQTTRSGQTSLKNARMQKTYQADILRATKGHRIQSHSGMGHSKSQRHADLSLAAVTLGKFRPKASKTSAETSTLRSLMPLGDLAYPASIKSALCTCKCSNTEGLT